VAIIPVPCSGGDEGTEAHHRVQDGIHIDSMSTAERATASSFLSTFSETILELKQEVVHHYH
jgi:hypothetical protein